MGNLAAAYDIMVHCNGNKIRIPNVDPTGYTYISLLFDVTEKALSKMPGNVNMVMQMRCEVPGKNCMMDVNDDDSVTEMFKIHKSKLVINLHVSDMEIILVDEENTLVNVREMNKKDNLGIEQIPSKAVVVDIGQLDDNYGDSSSDSLWKHNLHSDTDEELDDDRAVDEYSEERNTNCYDFEDNEGIVVVPDSDN